MEPGAPGACGACLSRGRELAALRPGPAAACAALLASPARPAPHAAPHTHTGAPLSCESLTVCWECSALLRRISLFKQRVRSAQRTLIAAATEGKTEFPSLSKLGIVLKSTYDYIYQHNADADNHFGATDNLKLEDLIKSEPEAGNRSIVPEYCAGEPCDEADSDEMSLGSLATESRATRNHENPKLVRIIRSSIIPVSEIKAKTVRLTIKHTKKAKPSTKRKSKYVKEIENLQQKNAELKKMLSKDEKGHKVISTNASEQYEVLELSEQAMWSVRERCRVDVCANSKWSCGPCLVGFVSGDLLEEHNGSLHVPKINHTMCDVCEVFFAPDVLAAHRSTHRLQYRCIECGLVETTEDSIRRHVTATHNLERCWKCKQCGQEFNSSKKLRYHRHTVHVDPVQCNICDRTFKWKPNLDKHMLQHSGGLPRFPCSVCGKTYAGKHGLHIHMKLHAPSDELHRCADCDIIFKNEYQLQVHLRGTKKHDGKKWYKHQCSECSKKFISENQLKQHFDYKHMGKDLHNCKICGRGYATLTGLHRHVKSIHEQQETPRICVCETCGRAFKSNRQLHHHKLIHSGERPYTCDVCGANFRQTSALYTHRRLVHLKIKQTKKKALLLGNEHSKETGLSHRASPVQYL